MSVISDLLPGVRALVLGDVMLDEHVWGEVRRISPEAPVPVVEVRHRSHVPGAAGNVAAGIVALGGEVVLGGVIGNDRSAQLLGRELAALSIGVEGLLRVTDRCTTTKIRIIAHGQQVVRIDEEKRQPLTSEQEHALLAWAEREIAFADVVVLSDYAKGVVTEALAEQLIVSAAAAGKPVVVDPKRRDFRRFRGATILTPNLDDARRAANVGFDEAATLAELGGRLRESVAETALLITLGSEGMALLKDGELLAVRSDAQEVYDVTGAGDTVVAALAVALGRRVPLVDAINVSNTAAGIAVSKLGTTTVSLAELSQRLCASRARPSTSDEG